MKSMRARAQAAYLDIFSRVVAHRLRRQTRVNLGSPDDKLIRIVARFQRSGGITNGALHNLSALNATNYSATSTDVSEAIRDPLRHIDCAPGGTWVFHCDATQFPLFAWPLRRRFQCRKAVGYFAWELAAPPAHWPNKKVVWDEIWTPSHFAAQSLSQHYACPVHVVPHVVLKSGEPRSWRKNEEPLTFITMADVRSSLVRKNPRAVIMAFKKAFPHERDVRLIVKLQVSRMTEEFHAIAREASDDQRIELICATLDRQDLQALLQTAHVYVSLHRAEGFGLPLLEARALGLATIATAYSGNLDFMSSDDSALIPFDLTEMDDADGVYGRVTWAEPHVNAAADSMRMFYDDPQALSRIAKAGWERSQPDRQLAAFSRAVERALN